MSSSNENINNNNAENSLPSPKATEGRTSLEKGKKKIIFPKIEFLYCNN